jgi:hypothetical protein
MSLLDDESVWGKRSIVIGWVRALFARTGLTVRSLTHMAEFPSRRHFVIDRWKKAAQRALAASPSSRALFTRHSSIDAAFHALDIIREREESINETTVKAVDRVRRATMAAGFSSRLSLWPAGHPLPRFSCV